MLKDAARLPQLKYSVYIIISVFVIAETFLKCLIVMCYCTFFIQETIKKMIAPKTQYVEIL